MDGSDLKFAHVILCAIPRSTVLFSILNFQVFHLFLNRVLNSKATKTKWQRALAWSMFETLPLAMAERVRVPLQQLFEGEQRAEFIDVVYDW